MWYLDLTLSTPAENLALDEALLLTCEESARTALRFWESRAYFAVLGAGRPRAADCNIAACDVDAIPILRRCSGGGTVLQGPGCLNFNLVIAKSANKELDSIAGTNRWVLSRVLSALESARLDGLSLAGTSDLIDAEGRKFSGNAQRRRKEMILFHGTILHDFDLDLVQRYLHEPDSQPEYREGRAHSQFIRNLPVDVEKFKAVLRELCGASDEMIDWPKQTTSRLVMEKYSTPAWNESF